MNIVSIMTDFIRRKKTNKFNKRRRKSLITSASEYRNLDSGIGSGRVNKNGLKRNMLQTIHFRFLRRKRKSAYTSSVKPGRKNSSPMKGSYSFYSIFKKTFKGLSVRLGTIGIKKIAAVSAVIVLGLASSWFIYGYIENKRMFENLALHEAGDVSDVLYDSISFEYDGQGSGDISGIEPVLLTSVEPVKYTVKTGDTLSEIAKKQNIKIGTLISYNKISDVRRLQVGMELQIPSYDGIPYEVKAGDSISGISKKYNVSVNSILDANDLDSDVLRAGDLLFIPGAAMNEFDYKKAMGTLFIYPTKGRLSSGFGYRSDPFTGKRRFHNGLDLANAKGTRIGATMAGRVADVGDRPSGYGKYVIIKHANGYQSLYGHLSKISVRRGQYVSQGEKIGEMGNTGRSTGPHLHFSIYKNNVPVNPKKYLW